ncbi:hypothetical protein IWW47_003588, partial [Coemansia sp. RSA 2052]
MCAQTEVEAQQRQQQSVRVTRVAERHFDSASGRCNWSAVSKELGLPLTECLDLFDASISTIQPRSLIETAGGWSKADVDELRLFVATNFADGSTVDWRIAGAYMNIDALECQRVGLGTYNDAINAVAYRRIRAYRESGVSWKDMHQHFLQYSEWTSLRGRYYWFHAKQEGKPLRKLTTKWTDDERHRAKEIVSQHLESTTRSELVDIVQCEFPDKPLSDVRLVVSDVHGRLKTRPMTKRQMNRLRELVAEYREDWDCIGDALGVRPSRARHNWRKYSGDSSAWSLDDTLRLQRLTEAGIKPEEAAKLLGAKSHWACLAKANDIRWS